MNISISMDKSLFENDTARGLNISTVRLKDGGTYRSSNFVLEMQFTQKVNLNLTIQRSIDGGEPSI